MIKHDYEIEKPKIVNTASIAGKYWAPLLTHHFASKFAVVGFTQSLALELAPLRDYGEQLLNRLRTNKYAITRINLGNKASWNFS
jgi:NAD(P)-dependent dehydrogenase (short-subunit alcohol dehydrogenase family)